MNTRNSALGSGGKWTVRSSRHHTEIDYILRSSPGYILRSSLGYMRYWLKAAEAAVHKKRLGRQVCHICNSGG